MARRLIGSIIALLLVAGFDGCGLGAGGGTSARVLVTRDFGSHALGGRLSQTVPDSETVLGMLERSFRVRTRDGGAVRSIDGLAGGRVGGRSADWFVYVNGIGLDTSAGHVDIQDGDRIWWDHHDRGATTHVPAVVGSYPEPFLHGTGGKRFPVVLECADDAAAACSTVFQRLGDDGIVAGRQTLGTGVGQKTIRVLVGAWNEIGGDAALAQLDQGPRLSGVYAHFDDNGHALVLLDQRGDAARTLGAGAGLVMATRFAEQAPTWAVTGTDGAGVTAAAQALDEQTLHAHFALAVGASRDVPVPPFRPAER